MQSTVCQRREIRVRGIVQGVGFRPFIYALARRYGLSGWVRNDADGVQIEVEGDTADLDRFLYAVTGDAPPLAVIETITWQPAKVCHDGEFRILESRKGQHRHAFVSPDVAVCADCLRELFDPADRLFRYPFINCTNCGPRFTITRAVPYDRATTTMAGFAMCAGCLREYEEPANRRFHAQPNACPACGPHVRLLDDSGNQVACADAIAFAVERLLAGAAIAVKGLGGYHLACNPFDPAAVATLRMRKARQDKPFALMARDLDQVRALCRVGPEEEALLTSPARPIVLLERREQSGLAEDLAPRQTTLGLMLAYTPLHYLLLHDAGIPLVMTSGNRSDEPIAYRDDEAIVQLRGIADYFLAHDRPIQMRCDDSVVRVFRKSVYPLRRARGYAPAPLGVTARFDRHILACGGELKSVFCVAKENHVFLSHHIGDLENYETLRSFREGIEHYCRLFDVRPDVVAYDLHPDYLATRFAHELEEQGLEAIGIQHHHAHIAACLADNERPTDEPVIGVALDGTGYGTDGAIWGGEFLTGSIDAGFVRWAHLQYLPLPGGEAAVRQPWRTALAQLIRLYGEGKALRLPLPPVRWAGERDGRTIARLLEHRLNTPVTSSAGRLFDAVGALVGVPGGRRATYEGQAAIELEALAREEGVRWSGGQLFGDSGVEAISGHAVGGDGGYPVRWRPGGEGWIVETDAILAGVVQDALAGRSVSEIAVRFHFTMAEVVVTGCLRLRDALEREGRKTVAVALSGGTFQNVLLLELVEELLTSHGFAVYRHRRVPTNDGGLCLGQAILANARYRSRSAG
jgi:hydrogenase maturation protein HypF